MTPAQYKAKMEEIKGLINSGRHQEAVEEVFSVVDTLGEDHAVAMLSLIATS